MNKNVRPAKLLGLFLLGLAVLCSQGWAATAAGDANPLRGAAKNMSVKTLNANAWQIYTTNFGLCVYPQSGYPGGCWGGPGYGYIYSGGMWVGALDSLDSVRVAVGENCGTGGSEMGPANPYTWDWTNWTTDPQSRVYLSTNPTDLAEWPLRDASNNPIVRSIQDGYATYSDENPARTFTGETPVGVRIRQSSYAWNTGANNDVVYFKFTIINARAYTLRNVYAGPCFDSDIGDESGTACNDRTSFDYTRNLAIQFQTDPEPGWPYVGVFGCRYFASPRNNTGVAVDVVDNQFPHTIQPDSALGLTAFKIFILTTDPNDDVKRYKLLRGINHMTDVEEAYDEWGAATPGDKRFVMSSGPFNLAPGDSTVVTIGVMAAMDTTAIKALSDSAQAFYNNHLGVGGDNPQTTLPAVPLLLANTPNPFDVTTEIKYQVSTRGPVELAVYNALGQRVRTLVDRQLGPGYYAARWDGRSDEGQRLSAGVYLYRLEAGGKPITKKLVLVR